MFQLVSNLSRIFRPHSAAAIATSVRKSSASQHIVEPTNKNVSVGPDGQVTVSLSFVEEPLGVPAQEGYGWPLLDFNEVIGPGGRYVIARKLGWGMSSSTWLARELQGNSHVAIKILNGYNTDLVQRGCVWELEALRLLSSSPSAHCLSLISNFTIPGKGNAGEHLCLVTQLLGGDVKSLHGSHRAALPFPLVKRILLHVLHGIAHAHSCGVVHTDLKRDNIFFDAFMSTEVLDELLVSDPPRRHPPETSYDDKTVEAAVSQPLPIPLIDEAMQRNYIVADFGSAQPITKHLTDQICPLPLRPPEITIGGPWNEKVDIWEFGCLVFELVACEGLFDYGPHEKYNLDEENHMLHQMICYTGENFSKEQLTVSSLADKFFDSTCKLKAGPRFVVHYPFESSIRCYRDIQEEDVLSTAALMRRCLRLDPAQRASAADLLSDPWFAGVD